MARIKSRLNRVTKPLFDRQIKLCDRIQAKLPITRSTPCLLFKHAIFFSNPNLRGAYNLFFVNKKPCLLIIEGQQALDETDLCIKNKKLVLYVYYIIVKM